MKSCVLYVYKETEISKPNLKFFLEHGVYQSQDTQFIFIVNDALSCSVIFPSHVQVIRRLGNARDMTTLKHVVPQLSLQGYDQYIVMNSSARGPFLPVYETRKWTQLFAEMLAQYDVVAPIGEFPSNIMPTETESNPFLHSYFLCFSTASFAKFCELLQTRPLLTDEDNILFERHVGKVMFQSFKCKTLLTSVQRADLRDASTWVKLRPSQSKTDVEIPKNYFGIDVHPYEIMFIKSARPSGMFRGEANSGISPDLAASIELYSKWKHAELPAKAASYGKTAVIITTYISNTFQEQMFLANVQSVLDHHSEDSVFILNDNHAFDVDALLRRNLMLLSNITVQTTAIQGLGEAHAWLFSMQHCDEYDEFVYIHDSVIVKKKTPPLQRPVQPLWYAPPASAYLEMHLPEVKAWVSQIRIGDWTGADMHHVILSNSVHVLFGSMARWSAEFARFLKTETNLSTALLKCNTRLLRCALERILMIAIHAGAGISHAEVPSICSAGDIFGHTHHFQNRDFKNLAKSNNEYALKVWQGR